MNLRKCGGMLGASTTGAGLSRSIASCAGNAILSFAMLTGGSAEGAERCEFISFLVAVEAAPLAVLLDKESVEVVCCPVAEVVEVGAVSLSVT